MLQAFLLSFLSKFDRDGKVAFSWAWVAFHYSFPEDLFFFFLNLFPRRVLSREF